RDVLRHCRFLPLPCSAPGRARKVSTLPTVGETAVGETDVVLTSPSTRSFFQVSLPGLTRQSSLDRRVKPGGDTEIWNTRHSKIPPVSMSSAAMRAILRPMSPIPPRHRLVDLGHAELLRAARE